VDVQPVSQLHNHSEEVVVVDGRQCLGMFIMKSLASGTEVEHTKVGLSPSVSCTGPDC